jgi:hypothetical protein
LDHYGGDRQNCTRTLGRRVGVSPSPLLSQPRVRVRVRVRGRARTIVQKKAKNE